MNTPKQKLEAYQRAITALEEYPSKITTIQQIDQLNLIGAKIKQYLKELLNTGKLELLQNLENDKEIKSLELFNRIWGIGKMRAQNFYDMGYRNLDDIERNQEKLLTNQQKIGLKYFEEINERMSREETTKIIQAVKEKLKQYPLQIIPVGSFRRGKSDCGDVDLIIKRKDDTPIKGLLGQIIQKLIEQNLLTDHLVMPKEHEEQIHLETYMGIIQLSESSKHRRIDIKVFEKDKLGCALLYFTGSRAFNKRIRAQAKEKGYILSEHGLFHASRIGETKLIGEQIPCHSEEAVFEKLGLEYLPPNKREY